MESNKKVISTVQVSSDQKQLIEYQVANTVLGQTSIFFISLVVLIAVLSGWFSFIMNRVTQTGDKVREEIANLKSELKTKRID